MSLPLPAQVKIRPPKPSDSNFILNSWLKSYRNSLLTRTWKNEDYYPAQTKLIQNLVGEWPTHIICNSLDEDQIYGYVCGALTENEYIVHYAYMKWTYRKLGFIKTLVTVLAQGKPVVTTHWMPVCRHLKWKKHDPTKQ